MTSTGRRDTILLAVLAITGAIVSLQQTLVIPLLLEIQVSLGTSTEDTSWLVTATLLSGAVSTPIVSRAADMYGKRRMILLSLAVLTVGSVIGALGTTLPVIVLGRVLQGFAAALIPVGISVLRDELPRERVTGAVALMSSSMGVGAAIGPVVAGLIAGNFSWHWVFWFSAIFGLIMFVAVFIVVPESTVRTPGRFDIVGALLLSLALVALLLVITKGGHWGWTHERTLLLALLAVVLIAAWVPWELRATHPMVDLRTAARRPILLTNIAALLAGFALLGNNLSTSQLLQLPSGTGYGFGLTALIAGLWMLPGGLAMIAAAPLAARWIRRFGGRVTLMIGLLTLAVGYVSRVFLSHEAWMVAVGAMVVAGGAGIAYAAMPNLIMTATPITETAAANGLNVLFRSVGTSVASAVVASLLSTTTVVVDGESLPAFAAFQHVFWIAAGGALLGAVVTALIPRLEPVPAAGPEVAKSAELVVTGTVHNDAGRPLRTAVVTVFTEAGSQVDWSRVESDGTWSLVVPSPGRYLRVVAADGYDPAGALLDLAPGSHDDIDLGHRLDLSGRVVSGGRPVGGALVAVTQLTGQSAGTTRTDVTGHWSLPLPRHGRHVVTVVDPVTGATSTTTLTTIGVSREVDTDLAAPPPPSPAGSR
ncbi:MFS transporter [Kribbia dieselivorans]|uniref:MFS transporter n=1 Tax=Kribbia dieselivorans TaxID=331526 RepID=UPI000A72130B|nr:MFS transporter [Kribbia dieselivorans]